MIIGKDTRLFDMAVNLALGWARKHCDQFAGSSHLLLGLLELIKLEPGKTVVEQLLVQFDVDSAELEAKLLREQPSSLPHNKDYTALGEQANRIIDYAHESADYLSDGPVHTGHLLIGLLRHYAGVARADATGGHALARAGLEWHELQDYLVKNSLHDHVQPAALEGELAIAA